MIIYLAIKACEMLERWCRIFSLWRLARRHRDWLKTHDHGWGTLGFAFVRLGYFGLGIKAMADWRERSGLKMWMLLNLAIALRQKRRWNELRSMLERAMTLERDGVFPKIRLMYALEQALQGNTSEAAGHFREIDATALSNYMHVQHRCLQGLLAVQQAPAGQRRKVLREEREGVMRAVRQYHAANSRTDYPRCIARMEADAKRE